MSALYSESEIEENPHSWHDDSYAILFSFGGENILLVVFHTVWDGWNLWRLSSRCMFACFTILFIL